MPTKPSLVEVKYALEALGTHLREARLRRELTIEEVAEQIGVSRKTVAEAERGKATTHVQVYAGMLWALGLLSQLENLATPHMEPDDELSMETDRKRAPRRASGRKKPESESDLPF
ncbi:MAG TPA: helix-turn-helix domain-containing protein [Myxococcales bacterium]